MNIQNSVQEENPPETTLQIYHRRLKVPIQSYLATVQEFMDPWEERAYQHFIHQYLEELGDPGIIGMVRQEQKDEYVYFDAAVRYPVNSKLPSFT